MQHIAPLQTDLAAKPAGDVTLDSEQMWFGAGSQTTSDSGREFDQVLTSEKEAQKSEKEVQKSDADKQVRDQPSDSAAQSKAQDNVKTPADASDKQVSQETEGKITKHAAGDNKPVKVIQDSGSEQSDSADAEVVSLPIIFKDVPINPGLNPQAPVNEEDINWVDLVEQVQSLAKIVLDKPQIQDVVGNVEDGQKRSGLIDELQVAIEEPILVGVDQPVVAIQLPIDTNQKIAQTDTAVELVIDISKQVDEVIAKPIDIENDLYIAPVDELKGVVAEQVGDTEKQELSDPLVPLLASILRENIDSETSSTSDELVETESVPAAEQPAVIVGPQQLTLQPKHNDKAVIDIVIKGSEEQQLRTFETITQLVSDSNSSPLTQNQQQNFIAALQAGIGEYKDQLKQGREPGISLKNLVNEALATAELPQANQADATIAKITEQVAQTLVLADAVQQMRRNGDELVRQAQVRLDANSLDVAQQTEGQRNTQSQAMLDKPANILKPEGQTQFAEKIRWIVNARNSFAEIRLDPPELGSVQVKVNMAGEAAAVSFVVQSQQARDALDQALPKLRDMLSQQGIELGQSSVQQDHQQQQGEQQQGQFAQGKADDGMDEIAGEVIEQRVVNGSAGGIDFYA